MITTGFTYRGVHSSKYNIICDPTSRQLIPERRRNTITVPGRSGSYKQEDGAYNDRSESFRCYYTKREDSNISLQAREIAAWLATEGTLCFDNEPDKYYDAYFAGSPPLTKHLKYGEFDLSFTYSPPFAYTAPQSLIVTLTNEGDEIKIPVAGTAPTPFRIIIKNNGDTVIENLRISYQLL
ncbi:MAG: phage tail family protein [Firmicutes bacterium]|nr:phage tail family protein [Bacillota bacterium]